MSESMRIVFAGTPEFAAVHLQALLDAGKQIVAVYTQPDRPAGRGQKLVASPVKQLALQHDIPVFQPQSLRTEEAQAEFAQLQPDLMVVVAYGLILPQAVLDIPRLGCINSHASLLPRWRGAAPIQRAIEAGDAQTGVTVMQMEAGLDTGPMLLKVVTDIEPTDTGATLHDRLAQLGSSAVVEAVDKLAAGELTGEAQQDDLATYAHKLSKDCSLIDWSQSADAIARAVRAFSPWPVSHTLHQGLSIKVHEAEVVSAQGQPGTILSVERDGVLVACAKNALLIKRMQLPNARAMNVADILNGRADLFAVGQVMGV